MIVILPRTDSPLTKVTATAGNWSKKAVVGRPYREFEIVLPEGITEAEVEVIAEPSDRKGIPTSRIVLRTGTPKPVVEPPKPVVKDEPKPKKKRVKRGLEIAESAELVDLDNTRSQVNVVDNDWNAE